MTCRRLCGTYSTVSNPVCFSDESEADQDHSALPEADQDIATEEQKKQTFEQSIKNNIVFVDNDEDVPINYAEGDESRKCCKHQSLSFYPINLNSRELHPFWADLAVFLFESEKISW